jgi:MFS family permease
MIGQTALSSFGTGLTLPFTLILLHEVRGISLPMTGILMALPGVVGLGAVPLSGILVDRFGPRRVLVTALLLQAVGSVLLGLAASAPAAAVALLVFGAGMGPSFPASSSLLIALVHGAQEQSRAFGLQFTLLNAAIGSGALLGGLVVDVHRPMTFTVLYAGNALACLLAAGLVPAAPARLAAAHPSEAQPSYREVLADPVFRRVCGVSFLLAMTGYAALDGGLAAFARVVGHVSPSTIASIFTVNTIVIVGGQLVVLRLIRGWRRSRAIAGTAALWGLAWLILGSLGVLPSGTPRVVAALLFGAVFGLGETLMAPTMGPLVNALATDRLRGRYNALSGATFSVAFVIAPGVAGALIGFGLAGLWLALLVAGCGAVAVVARRLPRRLSDEQDGLAAPIAVDDPALRLAV